ncbi:TetR/AcrR family transcriptional regulator [Pseudidiomarina sediminum]|uniref:TetR/AcrR family transcriptional regulator n=1 Tax=Pseudidiomarina sediminum TaxID=431675 RepID=A0A432Z7B4_9GAMM|nr:TetR/AcrR family transcriptional regulator [Pseudidiomarina sediminum]RUO73791.1 TetR/AcrR family transcriptional regulator [Pseudidiomarina sediminum]
MAYRETDRVRERKQATRETIVTTALTLVSEGGFNGLQMAQLARQSGVATGTLYRYFPSKEELCTAVFEYATEIEVAQVQQQLQESQQNIPEAIANALTTFATRALKAPTTAWALIAEPVAPEVVAARLHYRERYAGLFAQAIADGIAAGSLPEQDSNLSSRALVGAIAEALIGPLAQHSSAAPEQAIAHSIQFCLQAITAKPYSMTRSSS